MELPNYGYQQVALFSKSGREEVISFIKSAVVTGKKEYVFGVTTLLLSLQTITVFVFLGELGGTANRRG